MEQKRIDLYEQYARFQIANDLPFVLIAGPCVMESPEHSLNMATAIQNITHDLEISFIFKNSFDKANRSNIHSKRGVGYEESLEVFKYIRNELKVPILTDVHEPWQCAGVAEVVDVLQIPAFLCRQTDLIIEAAKTQQVVNIKKGQFLAPWEMKNIIEKVESEGNTQILLTERGTSFGYNNLVNDMRALPIMKETGYPVIFDATHSVQIPGGFGNKSGGERKYAPILARAAVAIGVAGVFMEVHDNPDQSFSDAANSLHLEGLENILKDLKTIDSYKNYNYTKNI